MSPRDLDALDIQETTDDLGRDTESVTTRATALGSMPVGAFVTVSLSAGVPSTSASRGARVDTVANTVTIALDPPLDSTYSAVVQDQSDEPLLYTTLNRGNRELEVAAYALGGAQQMLSAGDHSFTLLLYTPLSRDF